VVYVKLAFNLVSSASIQNRQFALKNNSSNANQLSMLPETYITVTVSAFIQHLEME